jgi:hypothetical protein
VEEELLLELSRLKTSGSSRRLSSIKKEVTSRITKSDYAKHRYGANEGINLGVSVASGGCYHGSIHTAKFLKDKTNLRKRLHAVIREMLQAPGCTREHWLVQKDAIPLCIIK